MMTTACAPTGVDLYTQAREANLEMKQEVAALQLHIFDGDWSVAKYGQIPEACGTNGYRFAFDRSTPFDDGWRLPQETTREKADALMSWLDEHGWTGILFRSYTGGVTSVTIEADKPAAHIEDLLITITKGIANDIVSLRVTGTCESGDVEELAHLMYPDGLSEYEDTLVEHPSAEPKFGLATPTPEP